MVPRHDDDAVVCELEMLGQPLEELPGELEFALQAPSGQVAGADHKLWLKPVVSFQQSQVVDQADE
jgi:hypothetical protein